MEMLPSHKPATITGNRKDPSLSHEVHKQLASGLSTDQVNNNLSKARAETVSETISGPKFVDNRMFAVKTEHSETEQLISSLHTNPCCVSLHEVLAYNEYVTYTK